MAWTPAPSAPRSIENSNKGAGHQHGEDPDHRGIADTDHGHEFDSLLHPAVFSRAVIKAYYGLAPWVNPLTGTLKTSLTELIMVITPT